MNYKHAKAMNTTLSPDLVQLVRRYRENTLDKYSREMVAPVIDTLDQAEKYIQQADVALNAFTQRLVDYRGRGFTEREQEIYQEIVLNLIDDILLSHEHILSMHTIFRKKRDYSHAILVERAFKERIIDYDTPVAFERYKTIVATPVYKMFEIPREEPKLTSETKATAAEKETPPIIDVYGFIACPLSRWSKGLNRVALLLNNSGIRLRDRNIINAITAKLMSSEEGKYVTVCIAMMNTGMSRLFGKAPSNFIVFQRETLAEGVDGVSVRIVNREECQALMTRETDFPSSTTADHRVVSGESSLSKYTKILLSPFEKRR